MTLLGTIATLLMFWVLVVCGATQQHPLQIYVLAGQSNMVGKGSIKHLQQLIQNDTSTENVYRSALWDDASNSFRIRNDVFIKYGSRHGNLTVGQGFAARDSFGPELMFGWSVGDAMRSKNSSQQILIIKTAWGGRSLAIDFRPPASGRGTHAKSDSVQPGWSYRDMMMDIHDTLQNLSNYVPSYNESLGYEFAGFVWFQGWNDMLYAKRVMEYGKNLANLIRDVRRDLDAPDLPFVVGELGMHGMQTYNVRVLWTRVQELSVTLMDEFRNTSLFVRTAPFVDKSDDNAYDGEYHYYGRADTFFHIGQAFGRSILDIRESL